MVLRMLRVMTLVLILSLLAAAPALAVDKVPLNLNGESAGMIDLYGDKGISMISVDAYARHAGADISWSAGNTVVISENGTELSLATGQKEALLDEEIVSLPAEPVIVDGSVFVPLRFVAGTFGFDVHWNEQQNRVELSRQETRDGMTPLDLMVKSTAETQKVNTYGMDGYMTMVMSAEADGNQASQAPVQMKMRMTGQLQNDPMEIYLKQTIDAGDETVPQGTEIETYMTAEKMYIKMPGQGWLVQDMPFGPEFWQQQQEFQSDPLRAAEQIKEMGMLLNFGNDVQIDGRDYYVVNATLDMEKFRAGYPKMLQQVMQGISGQGAAENQEEVQQVLQKLVDSMEMDYYYTVYIDKETLFTDVFKLDARIKMNMDLAELGAAVGETPKPEAPGEFKIDMDMSGEFKITNPGAPFEAPDVSDATKMNAGETNATEMNAGEISTAE